jgi:UDPglucose 6-dehydrogenase
MCRLLCSTARVAWPWRQLGVDRHSGLGISNISNMEGSTLRVAMIGAGYVGLTTGVAVAHLGHDVICVDKDQDKLAMLQQGISPIHERGMNQLLERVRNRIRFTDQTTKAVSDADIIMIAVGTPPKENGEADTGYVEAATGQVAEGLREGRSYILVVKSTVPIGTNARVRDLVEEVLKRRGISARVHFASNPEFLREGRSLEDTFYPDRIVVGADESQAFTALKDLYRPILEQSFNPLDFLIESTKKSKPVFVETTPTSAEMIKYASNAFLAMKISFANEIAGLCEKVGADIEQVTHGMGLDSRIGNQFLAAGLGWGGSCFPKDTAALLATGAEYDYSMPLISAARAVNERQRCVIIERLQEVLKVLLGRTIGILGLSFKPDTDDVRESPAIYVIRHLVDLGAHVRAYDPAALDNARKVLGDTEVEFATSPQKLAEGCDALVLATEWDVFRDLDLERLAASMRFPLLVDGRNLYEPSKARQAGLIYIGIGRGSVELTRGRSDRTLTNLTR